MLARPVGDLDRLSQGKGQGRQAQHLTIVATLATKRDSPATPAIGLAGWRAATLPYGANACVSSLARLNVRRRNQRFTTREWPICVGKGVRLALAGPPPGGGPGRG